VQDIPLIPRGKKTSLALQRQVTLGPTAGGKKLRIGRQWQTGQTKSLLISGSEGQVLSSKASIKLKPPKTFLHILLELLSND
jgi:hypothetical protein